MDKFTLFKESRETVEIDVPTLFTYTFDDQNELLEGVWRFEFWDGPSQLFEKTFVCDFPKTNAAQRARHPWKSEGIDSVHSVVEEGDVGACLELAQAGIDLDTRDRHTWTPLMSAVCNQRLTVLNILLSYGANPSLKTDRGKTPLMLAAEKGNIEMITDVATERC